MYSREDFETRPEFTEPEILRTSLGAVVLHMLSVGVARTAKDVTDFGFIDPPDMKAVSDGFNELTELKAIGRKRGLLVRGGEVNTERCAIMLVDEFRACKWGRISLERPPQRDDLADFAEEDEE